jgi:hypothetical protein
MTNILFKKTLSKKQKRNIIKQRREKKHKFDIEKIIQIELRRMEKNIEKHYAIKKHTRKENQ